MQLLNINILGLSEFRLLDSHDILMGHTKLYYSDNINTTDHWNRVAILVDKTTQKCLTGFLPISDGVMMRTFKKYQAKVDIIQTYAPTAENYIEE